MACAAFGSIWDAPGPAGIFKTPAHTVAALRDCAPPPQLPVPRPPGLRLKRALLGAAYTDLPSGPPASRGQRPLSTSFAAERPRSLQQVLQSLETLSKYLPGVGVNEGANARY